MLQYEATILWLLSLVDDDKPLDLGYPIFLDSHVGWQVSVCIGSTVGCCGWQTGWWMLVVFIFASPVLACDCSRVILRLFPRDIDIYCLGMGEAGTKPGKAFRNWMNGRMQNPLELMVRNQCNQ